MAVTALSRLPQAAPAGAARIAVACTDATQLLLLSPANGSLLATLDTAQLKNHMAVRRRGKKKNQTAFRFAIGPPPPLSALIISVRASRLGLRGICRCFSSTD